MEMERERVKDNLKKLEKDINKIKKKRKSRSRSVKSKFEPL